MSSAKIAIKSLTASDLSFFKAHVKLSKQKAINLNSDIFIERFYPGLKGTFDQVPIALTVMGPGGKAAHRLMRKALRTKGAKNWRLNGEVIHDPDGEPERYDGLAEGDFAVISFEGNERPRSASLVLVSVTSDSRLHTALANAFDFSSQNSMRSVQEATIADLRATTVNAYAIGEHPFDALFIQDTVEDILFGSTIAAPTGAMSSRRSVAMTAQELRDQLLVAEETGQLGEELFEVWLTNTGHDESDFEWVSATHARSAFDYDILAARWLGDAPHVFVDVKTTRGSFERPLHMSIAELRFAAATPGYRIARIYDVAGSKPRLKILRDISAFAQQILASLVSLPANVTIDSVQIKPDVFTSEYDGALG
ncbi:hypothetical protein OV208_14840 [Corallococcus sp. bb12-1]|uniref:hypothetical protein n=1 Tax=Corallococcus sp. bb12-1 TaxID=2996784 RepID=UPI00226EC998|nr:hypothetical protein [Corallococcus sp. bb12-1]MCY1042599.1 hypothetical protein [Corallococcus sp. bb12-1]